MRLIALNKPFDVLCQFTAEDGRACLKDYVAVPGVYAAGRLDRDSEGLLLLTDSGALQHRIADPRHKWAKTYVVQVEGEPDEAALQRLRAGVDLGDFHTQPCEARQIAEPGWLWPRTPPVRFRKSVPTHWLELVLREGKNRQVRRMTAKVGLPTLRLIRTRIGPISLDGLLPGEWRDVNTGNMAELQSVLHTPHRQSVRVPVSAGQGRRDASPRNRNTAAPSAQRAQRAISRFRKDKS